MNATAMHSNEHCCHRDIFLFCSASFQPLSHSGKSCLSISFDFKMVSRQRTSFLTCVQLKDQEQNTDEKGSAMSSFQRSEESSTSQTSPTSCLTNDRENTSSTSDNATANEADQESSADSPPRAVVHKFPNSVSLEKFFASPPKASEPSSGSSSSTILPVDPSLISQEQQQRPNRKEVLEQSAVSINPTACIQATADEENLQESTFTFEVSQDARWLTYRNVFCIPSADMDCLKACCPWD